MRWAGLVVCALIAGACGRLAFDPRGDGGEAGDGGGDSATTGPPPLRIAYLKSSDAAAGDAFGNAVAISGDGQTVAVGAPLHAAEAGAVYIFRRTGDVWTQEAKLVPTVQDAGDQFGWSVSLSNDGNTLAIGARREDSSDANTPTDNNAMSSGAAYIFARTGTAWSQAAYIKAPTIDGSDAFGERVALSGDASTLAVAAIYEDSATTVIDGDETNDNATDAGAVWIFTGPPWEPQAYLKAPNAGPGDVFGYQIDISNEGNVVAVGAYREDLSFTGIDPPLTNDDAPNSGIAYTFTRDLAIWTLDVSIKASNTGMGDNFGYGLALAPSAATLAITAPSESSLSSQADDLSLLSGAAYVFAGEPWEQLAFVKAVGQGADDELGHCAGLSNVGSLIVGAPFEDSGTAGPTGDPADDSETDAGALYVFEQSTSWLQSRYVKAPNPGAGDYFGIACAIAADSATIVVGAPFEDGSGTGIDPAFDDSAPDSGAAYVYY